MSSQLFAPGHTACSGCGMPIAIKLILEGSGKDIIVVSPTGCLEVTTTRYPTSAWGVPWIHSLFENAAAVASGIERALKVLNRDANVIVIAGDGATVDIGIGALSGMFERGDNVTYICYDNEAYMNTGVQRCSSTPYGASTTTSPVGKLSFGEDRPKKDLPAIAVAHGVPYVATASIGYPKDVIRKIKRAKEIVGPKYIHILTPCPTGWRFDENKTIEIAKLAVETGLFPIYEIEGGTLIKVKKIKNRKPVEEYLRLQGRYRHILKGFKDQLEIIQEIADKNAEKFGLDG
ncbi:MAG: pyruvate synthase subunit beta [Candidatus Methanoliparum thermophilum]|uniref:Pyruvate synthase subunit beta n=1 Tax=Methanoliparum thermophilum TaxID=2491083 RepID=A0A520KS75_METT2|nr:pyruvate synthase subunit PorB [Candidatus Methanoliparum sp. LAM-1]RZN64607.1 MAG: pyruvate synthase subunit beta [Candidatus Methanoliparum thermophilum]BDC35770.1 Pyruvate synthase subunit B [Candidatus Methanoliparum sp. LAM-1]